MKFLICFGMFLIGSATTQSLIQDSCKKAVAIDKLLIYNDCVTSLEQDPLSKTTTSLEELLIASIKRALLETTRVKGIAEKMLMDKRYTKDVVIQLKACVEMYDNAEDCFNGALKSAKSRDYFRAGSLLSDALISMDTCEEGFEDIEALKSQLTSENRVLRQKILIPLDFSSLLL